MESEHHFTLPIGYADASGRIHRQGSMRRARAGDEIACLEDPRVRGNRAYVVILILARVVTRLGDLTGEAITPEVIERLYSADLACLQDLYLTINGLDEDRETTCPHCGKSFKRARLADPQGSP